MCVCVCLLVIVKKCQTHDPRSTQGLMATTGPSDHANFIFHYQQGTAFEPRAPLVVWAGMAFSQVWLHQCCDSPHLGGERYKTLQGLPSRSRGKWNMENVTGILWHFAPWAFLKRVKRQLRSGNDSSEHESAAGRDTLHRFNPSTSEVSTWTCRKKSKCILQVRVNAAKNQCIYFN